MGVLVYNYFIRRCERRIPDPFAPAVWGTPLNTGAEKSENSVD